MIPNYDDCIWEVSPEKRQCEFCVFRDCDPRQQKEKERIEPEPLADGYIKAMSDAIGVDIRGRCRQQIYVWGRNIVAYQLVKDGLSQKEVAGFLGIDRSTVYHCIRSVENMLVFPKSYPKEMEVWRNFQEIVILHKK